VTEPIEATERVAAVANTEAAILVGADPRSDRTGERTALVLVPVDSGLPKIGWVGTATPGLNAADVTTVRQAGTLEYSNHGGDPHWASVVPEVSHLWFGRPGLAGHRVGGKPAAGLDWSTAFQTQSVRSEEAGRTVIRGIDAASELGLVTEIEELPGGALRIRHVLTNTGDLPYVVDHLDVVVPVDERATEALDLTGRWGRERSPQRHRIADGLWLRDGRSGRTNFESPTLLVAGTSGFGFNSGLVWGIHVAWSGNSTYYLEQQPAGLITLGGGELLLPGELVLERGESYGTPWVVLTASASGLDGLSAQLHAFVRSLPAHPNTPRPVVGNVWEAVYFNHDLDRLKELADRCAEVGIERFVLDDGWFGARRDDTAGLGDWVVSEDVWPVGLGPIIDHVRARGMRFGLWFEPEMINRDSDLFRSHPDWILAIGDRPPLESRNQLVLDLGRPEVRSYLFSQIDAVLSAYPIEFVKWDHNRPLADAGSGIRGGAAGAHSQTLGFYALLDDLRRAHPDVEWESCASGGGRIDLGVIERVERFWTSDMTDALSRQLIQRWTSLIIPPEYLGAHVSAPVNHQTGRQLSLDFRAATALFGSMGVEWDVTSATDAERKRLGQWISAYQRHRALLHSGRVFRADVGAGQIAGEIGGEIYVHGVVSADRSQAIVAYVQLDERVHEPAPFIVSGLDAETRYRARQVVPPESAAGRHTPAGWRGEGYSFTGGVLGSVGLPAPLRGPETATVVHLSAE
jgi:alpha-galactosidase